jgi:molybdopterin converting factor small subunit
MKVLYFALLRERVGMPEETITPPGDVRTVADLVTWLRGRSDQHEAAREPGLRSARPGHQAGRRDRFLPAGDRGLTMTVRVQREDFDTAAELDRMTAGNTQIGAAVTFTGLVRDFAGSADVPVQRMTLEHYPGMTQRQLETIVAEVEARWPLDG